MDDFFGTVAIWYTVKGPSVTFSDVTSIVEGADGSLKLTRDADIVRVAPGYLYYILTFEEQNG